MNNLQQQSYSFGLKIQYLSHYSNNFELCDFFLFPKYKLATKGMRFETLAAVKIDIWIEMVSKMKVIEL